MAVAYPGCLLQFHYDYILVTFIHNIIVFFRLNQMKLKYPSTLGILFMRCQGNILVDSCICPFEQLGSSNLQ